MFAGLDQALAGGEWSAAAWVILGLLTVLAGVYYWRRR